MATANAGEAMINFEWFDAKQYKPNDGDWVYIMFDARGSYSPNKALNECEIGIGAYSATNDQWYKLGYLDGKSGRIVIANSKVNVIYWSGKV